MSKICIIPARGGSKRIPRKNIKHFLGKPIIAYSIQAAIDSKLFDRIIVSTDDEEIKKIAIQFGAEVPFLRSSENSCDHAPVASVLIEVLETLAEQGNHYDEVCCLFATAPFITCNQIVSVNKLVNDIDCDSAFTVQDFGYPIFRALKNNETGNLEMVWKEHQNTRSQDLPKTFHDAGQVYWIKTQSLLTQKTLFTKNAKGFELKKSDAVDIDTEEDWKTAELFYQLIRSK